MEFTTQELADLCKISDSGFDIDYSPSPEDLEGLQVAMDGSKQIIADSTERALTPYERWVLLQCLKAVLYGLHPWLVFIP